MNWAHGARAILKVASQSTQCFCSICKYAPLKVKWNGTSNACNTVRTGKRHICQRMSMQCIPTFQSICTVWRSDVCYFCLSISCTLFAVFWHFGMLSSRGGSRDPCFNDFICSTCINDACGWLDDGWIKAADIDTFHLVYVYVPSYALVICIAISKGVAHLRWHRCRSLCVEWWLSFVCTSVCH